MGRITLTVVLTMALGGAVSAEIIDRVLAVVEGRLITLSDVRGVVRMGLEPTPATADPVAAVLETLTDRQLILLEVDRYAPPEPSPAQIDARVQALRTKFPDALAFETALHESGLQVEALRRYIRDSLRIDTYLQQRFTAAIPPTQGDLVQYYRDHAAEFTRAGAVLPFDDVQDEIRRRIAADRRDASIREWLEGVRRRANMVKLYLPK